MDILKRREPSWMGEVFPKQYEKMKISSVHCVNYVYVLDMNIGLFYVRVLELGVIT